MTYVLTGLDIEAKARLVEEQLTGSVGAEGLEFILARTDHADAESTETASALLHVHVKDADPARAGRAFSQAAVELTLAPYPGCTLPTPPGDAAPFGIFTPGSVAQQDVAHVAVLPSGKWVPVPPPSRVAAPEPAAASTLAPTYPAGPTSRVPLGSVA